MIIVNRELPFMSNNKNESAEARASRKASYVSYVLSKNHPGANEDQLIKEAEEKFEKENPLN